MKRNSVKLYGTIFIICFAIVRMLSTYPKNPETIKYQKDNHMWMNQTKIPTGSIRKEWLMPGDGYCYSKSSQWSKCSYSHRLYPKRSKEEILSKAPMCHYEPMCWLSFNWKETQPPDFKCNVKESFRFYDLSYHDGTMADHSTFIEQSLNPISNTNHEVFLCNVKHSKNAIRNSKYPFKICPHNVELEDSWLIRGTEGRALTNWKNYHNDPHFKEVDGLIVGLSASIFEHWMAFNKTIIVAAGHRFNLGRCTKEGNNNLITNMRRLAAKIGQGSTPFHAIGAFSIYDVEYIRHYTGISPIYLMGTMFNAVDGNSWIGSSSNIILNSHRHPEILTKNELIQKPEVIFKGGYTLKQLSQSKAVVVIPYSINNYKSLEQYAMNIPMFAPTVEFALQEDMFEDRVVTAGDYLPYCENLTDEDLIPHPDSPYSFSPNVRKTVHGDKAIPDEKFWIQFSDIFHWPCIQYYSSYEDLLDKLNKITMEQLKDISNCMKHANAWRKAEMLQNMCWVTKHMEKNRKMPDDYHQGLFSLYNVYHVLPNSSVKSGSNTTFCIILLWALLLMVS